AAMIEGRRGERADMRKPAPERIHENLRDQRISWRRIGLGPWSESPAHQRSTTMDPANSRIVEVLIDARHSMWRFPLMKEVVPVLREKTVLCASPVRSSASSALKEGRYHPPTNRNDPLLTFRQRGSGRA